MLERETEESFIKGLWTGVQAGGQKTNKEGEAFWAGNSGRGKLLPSLGV